MSPLLKFSSGQILILALFIFGVARFPRSGPAPAGAGSGPSLEQLQVKLQECQGRSGAGAEELALRGLIEGVRSRDAVSSAAKVMHLRRCKALLAEGIRTEPENPLVRAHHATLELNLPRFFQDPRGLAEDLRVIRAALEGGQRPLAADERAYLSGVLAHGQARSDNPGGETADAH